MEKELDQYLESIRRDYGNYKSMSKIDNEIDREIRDRMKKEFFDSVTFEEGYKYIKVIAGNSVHSFIVKKDDKQFKRGDILKAASWNAPSRNFSRGNILSGGYKVSWTGAV